MMRLCNIFFLSSFQKGLGAPQREPAVSEEEQKKMMAYYYKRQEDLKVFFLRFLRVEMSL